MIAALPAGVEGVVGDGRSIRLGRRFDAVLLASHLVNLPGDGGAFAATAVAHVRPDGVVIGQTYPPGFDPTAGVGKVRTIGSAHVELVRAERVGDRLESTVRYGVDGQEWTQQFTSVLLDEAALRDDPRRRRPHVRSLAGPPRLVPGTPDVALPGSAVLPAHQNPG